MRKTVVINVVGLTRSLIGAHTPRLKAFSDAGAMADIGPVIPAVTTTVQSTYLTGKLPTEHGLVGNGWYFRDECEIKFWKQSNKLVQAAKVWDHAKQVDPTFTCANLFWWYNMYSTADYSVTPRPMYPADGRKLPDVYSHPADLRDTLQKELGTFPLFNFWGPATSINATRWIADAAIRVDRQFNPTLTLVYLPHLDYVLQKEGPRGRNVGKELGEVDVEVGKLIDHWRAPSRNARVMIVSEYGISQVNRAVHLNRVLREAGIVAVREEMGRELLDAGASRAFAVADHQIAHIYINDEKVTGEVKKLVEQAPGVARVLDKEGKRAAGLDHERAGDLVALAERDSWFTYYYWLNDARAPDFARTVDIHRKPGYDPAELFIDPTIPAPKWTIGKKLLKKKLGFRYLMDVIPLDATLVKGSHGVEPAKPSEGAVVLTDQTQLLTASSVGATEVHDLIMRHLVA